MLDPNLGLAEPLIEAACSRSTQCSETGLALTFSFLFGCVLLWSQAPASRGGIGRQLIVPAPTSVELVRLEALEGTRVGQFDCGNAVGLFYGTVTGQTEQVADIIGKAVGIEARDIADVEPKDLVAYDGLIVGAPTRNSLADELRSDTMWDDYLEELRNTDLCNKRVAIFGIGDSLGYGDGFCDAIEELHATFEAAGAKMLGYVNASGYEYEASKSVRDGKFLGLALDHDNEDDKTHDRVTAWVEQLRAEGMPLNAKE